MRLKAIKKGEIREDLALGFVMLAAADQKLTV